MSAATWTTQRREIGDFHRLVLRHVGRLTLSPGQKPSLLVDARAELLPKIQSEVRDETLYLEIGRSWLERMLTRLTVDATAVHYQLSVPLLRELIIVGRAQIGGSLPPGDAFSLRTNGTVTAAFTNLQLGKLEVEINGQADVALSGRTDEQTLRINGSGSLTAVDMVSRRARVHLSGQANVSLWASDTLMATITGMGTVRYRGQPSIEQEIHGMGAVKAISD